MFGVPRNAAQIRRTAEPARVRCAAEAARFGAPRKPPTPVLALAGSRPCSAQPRKPPMLGRTAEAAKARRAAEAAHAGAPRKPPPPPPPRKPPPRRDRAPPRRLRRHHRALITPGGIVAADRYDEGQSEDRQQTVFVSHRQRHPFRAGERGLSFYGCGNSIVHFFFRVAARFISPQVPKVGS